MPEQSDTQPLISIIPAPRRLTSTGSGFQLDRSTVVTAEPNVEPLTKYVSQRLGIQPAPASGTTHPAIRLFLDQSAGPEGYRLSVSADGVQIAGGNPAGAFYGVQSLFQLLPPEAFSGPLPEVGNWPVPGVEIEDRPRFRWRGAMLDVGRHFQSKEFILRYLDLMALHKLNVFHFHLTDDQGWRIEIKRYPKLTEVGAWRTETLVGREWHQFEDECEYDGIPHGGFYTQAELREIVAHAADRFITVVPEIEMPGHSRAALAAYPELGNLSEPTTVYTRFGINKRVVNVEDSTIEFFQNVLSEVMEIFPGQFIHIGGDECPKDEWRASSRAQERMRELGLHDEHELQSWFIRRIDSFLAERGRRLTGWDEIMEGGLAPGATVMSWRGEGAGVVAAAAGHDVVMTPQNHTYYNFRQQLDETKEPVSIISLPIPLRHAHAYEPVPAAAKSEAAAHILGAQYQLWSEYIKTPRDVEYMAFPRACAFSECVWCGQKPDYQDFLSRLRLHLRRLDALEVNYRRLDISPPL